VCSKEMFDDADDDMVVIKEGDSTSSSSSAAKEMEEPDKAAEEEGKPKAKASRKRAQPQSPSPTEDTKSVVEESVKLPSKVYPNPTNVKVLDCYILPYENDCSDHCPIVLIVERNVALC
jgi:hypothetical protein